METSAWIALASLALALCTSVVVAAVAYGRLVANVKNLTDVVNQLAKDARLDASAHVRLQTVVESLDKVVEGLQNTLRDNGGLAGRIAKCESRLDVLEAGCRRNHPER